MKIIVNIDKLIDLKKNLLYMKYFLFIYSFIFF